LYVSGNLPGKGEARGQSDEGAANPGQSSFLFSKPPAGRQQIRTPRSCRRIAGTFAPGRQIQIRVTGMNVPQGLQKFSLYAYNVRLSS